MGNGQDEVKKAADYITDDNDHDGIAKALSMFLDIELEGQSPFSFPPWPGCCH